MIHRQRLPALYYIHPLLAGPLSDWDPHLQQAAAMGFSAVATAPLFAPGETGNVLLAADDERLNPSLGENGSADEGIAGLVEKAARHGLALVLDLVADRVAAGGPLADRFGFRADARFDGLDPRVDPAERGAADLPVDRQPWLDHLAARLARLAGLGVAGFRCLGPERLPADAWHGLIAAVRASRPDTVFLAVTPGLPFEARAALSGAGFDAVFSSVRWWDARSGWIVDENDVHRRIAPAIGFPEAPFGRRLAREVDNDEDTRRAMGRALWLAASLSDGLLIPMGFEYAARDPMSPLAGSPRDWSRIRAEAPFDLSEEIAAAAAFVAERADDFDRAEMRTLTGASAPLTAVLRTNTADIRQAERARLVLVNPDLRRAAEIDADHLLTDTGGRFQRFLDIAGTLEVGIDSRIRLGPGDVRVLEGNALEPIRMPGALVPDVDSATAAPRLAIEAINPSVDGGRFPVKRTVGSSVTVTCDLIADGHDRIAASLLYRAADRQTIHEVRMQPLGNDRWTADMPLERLGRWYFTVETWRDEFATYLNELSKKHAAGLKIGLELEEGRRLVAAAAERTADGEHGARLRAILDRLNDGSDAVRVDLLLAPETAEVMAAVDHRPFRLRHEPWIPLDAERTGAGFASWYELFPRSQSGDPARHGTFDDVIAQLPRVRDMGFDVLYFPPIHPIGRTNRKGRNNTLTPGPDDPGSPYAIGSEAGGHDAVHPELGTLEDFRRLVAAAAEHGLEIALDFAIQCSPDHPWLKEHPDWFAWRPDGSIRYAENPPKKYEDIVNVDFYAPGAVPALWIALRDVVLFWVNEGVRLFRVDNPHTKPFPFWEWLIAEVRGRHPDAVFLAEAFTRPKVMYRLAKIGFSQSYTYFTWRNTKAELTEYLTELTSEAPKEFFRPHFFVNTPDINPAVLQASERSAHLIRAALATTLSGLWGMYNGFEICEGRPYPGKEEYLDSEKYEIRAWDWSRPGNIIAEITRLNRIRRDNPALHSHLGLTFLTAWNDQVLWFEKSTPGRENVLLVAVSLDPHAVQEADVEIPLWSFGIPDHGSLPVEDLMRGHRFAWTGKHQRLRLDPHELPFSIWRVDAAKEF
ncbi:alpha-1,4-glucan--maltose-1-phosphate maltosyltransferase [Chthonobacter albigriseus]|uniref:alpha-1,4-glucan--maltose-1-phosphate maltosyltransferase n=1 Tax=Chthonobacter albigriseus TaxID=1683161 RepID=UPI0015EF3734|nr:alpha-1,4-glucan--maltose-1-phosphate maltosyltransferase [Chthonobacter albigriseus]